MSPKGKKASLAPGHLRFLTFSDGLVDPKYKVSQKVRCHLVLLHPLELDTTLLTHFRLKTKNLYLNWSLQVARHIGQRWLSLKFHRGFLSLKNHTDSCF